MKLLRSVLLSVALLSLYAAGASPVAQATERERVFLTFEGKDSEAEVLEAEASRFSSKALEFGNIEFAGSQTMEAVYTECNEATGTNADVRRECNLRAANREAVEQLLVLSSRKLSKRTFEITLQVWSPATNGQIYGTLIEVEAKTLAEAARKAYPELASQYMCRRGVEKACTKDVAVGADANLDPTLAAAPVNQPVVEPQPQWVEPPKPTARIEIPGMYGLMPDMSATGLVWQTWVENGTTTPGALYALTSANEVVALRTEYWTRTNCLGSEDVEGVRLENGWNLNVPSWMPWGWHEVVVVNPDPDGSGANYIACRNLSEGTVLMTAVYVSSSQDDTDWLRSSLFYAIEETAYARFGAAPSSYPATTDTYTWEETPTEPTPDPYASNEYSQPYTPEPEPRVDEPAEEPYVEPEPYEDPYYEEPYEYQPNEEHLEGMVSVDVAFLADLPADDTIEAGYGALLRMDGAYNLAEDALGFAAGFKLDFGYTSSANLIYDARLMLGAGLQAGPILLMVLGDAGIDQACRSEDVESNAIVAGYVGYEGRLRWIVVEDLILDLIGSHAFRGDDTQAVRGEVRMGFVDYDGMTTFGSVGLTHYFERTSLVAATLGIGF